MTTVINIRDLNQGEFGPNYVYIGRAMPWQGGYLEASPYCKPHGYTTYTYQRELLPKLAKRAVTELRDKVLVCWCKPARCHGDALARFVNLYWMLHEVSRSR